MLLTESVYFGATTQHKVVLSGRVSAPSGNYGTGVRVFKAFVNNDGDNDVTVTLDGSSADAGYGLDWTNRASVTVKAKGNAILSGAIRGTEEHWRLAVKTASGTSEGRIEIFDQSDNLKR